MNDQELNNIYNERFAQMNHNPPDGLWEDIARHLDEEEQYNHHNKGKRVINRIVFAIAFVGILSGVNSDIFESNTLKQSRQAGLKRNYTAKDYQKQHTSSGNTGGFWQSSSLQSYTGSEKAAVRNADIPDKINSKSYTLNKSNVMPSKSSYDVSDDLKNNTDISSQKQPYERSSLADQETGAPAGAAENNIKQMQINKIARKDVQLHAVLDFMELPLTFKLADDHEDHDDPGDNNKVKGFYAGIGYFINNSWLINRFTYEGFRATSLSQTKSDFNGHMGIQAGYDFGNKSVVQAELQLSKKQLQHYSTYDNGTFINKKLKLYYTQINLLYKYHLTKDLHQKLGTLNVFAGGYYGLLNDATQVVNGKVIPNQNQYTDYDAGLIAGLEYEVFASNQLSPFLNIRSNYGLVNISSGTAASSRLVNPTRNLSFGVNFGIKYTFND